MSHPLMGQDLPCWGPENKRFLWIFLTVDGVVTGALNGWAGALRRDVSDAFGCCY